MKFSTSMARLFVSFCHPWESDVQNLNGDKKIDQEIDVSGVVRSISDSPPAHYSLEIQLFSQLKLNCSKNGYESKEFKAGGYKWKLVFHPKGNIKKGVNDHISLYLVIVGVADEALVNTWDLNVDFRLFLLDQNKLHYLVFQDLSTKKICIDEETRSVGFDELITLKEFNDASNGFLIDNRCVFGAEVYVCEERRKVKRECLERLKVPIMCRHVCKIENFSSIGAQGYHAEPFSTGEYKWIVILYPEGSFKHQDGHISLYFKYVGRPLPTGSKLLVDLKLGFLGQPHHISPIYYGKGQVLFGDNSFWGWTKLISDESFRKWYLVKDVCLVEAEVIVHGISKSLN